MSLMRRLAVIVGALSASIVLLGAPSAAPAVDDRPALAGTWELDPTRSDLALRAGGGGFRPGPGGGGSGRPPGGGGGGRRPGDGGGARPPGDEGGLIGAPMEDRGIQELLRAKMRLVIEEIDSTVTLKDDSGWTRELRPDGGKIREELAQGGPAEVETKWKGDKLVSARRLDSGAQLTERFARDKKTGALTIELEFKVARAPRSMKLKRIYLAADSTS